MGGHIKINDDPVNKCLEVIVVLDKPYDPSIPSHRMLAFIMTNFDKLTEVVSGVKARDDDDRTVSQSATQEPRIHTIGPAEEPRIITASGPYPQ